ncbi:outer membrane beta-barrel protein [Reichenbachiella sp. MALMAid0571]|uniref:outer membrane beta-barrel protein n=1 Tax=Reichenbachiella sp. MALMAid0571 TaxID=3143939 RepID=UPI0032DFF488
MKKYTLILLFVLFANIVIASGKDDDDDKKSVPDLPGVILIDFGFNFFQSAPSDLDINWFKSKSFGMYYMKSYKMGKKMSFDPAIGISFEKYGFSKERSIGYETTGTTTELSIIDLSGYDKVKKSQLAMNYIDIPLQLRYYLKSNDVKGSAYVSVGAIASLLIESHTKVKFKDDGRDQTTKHRDNFEMNKLRYGLQGRFGFGSVNFFYKYYFSNLFNSNGPVGATDITTNTIGISISGL